MTKMLSDWTEEFKLLPVQTLGEIDLKLCVNLLSTKIPHTLESLAEMSTTPFLAKLFIKRAIFIGLKISPEAAAFISMIVSSNTSAVMYCYFLRSIQVSKPGEPEVTMQSLCSNIFPLGFPSEGSLERMWDAQKMHGGVNLLDTINPLTDFASPAKEAETA